MPFKRKKESVIKKMLSTQLFVLAILLCGVMFLMGCPERLALRFFIILESFNISRITASLIWIFLMILIFVLISFVTIKEIRWNNKHLNLPVIELDGNAIKVNNYNDTRIINVNDINKIIIMNKDSSLQIKMNDNKTIILEYLISNRCAYEELEKTLSIINSNIEFEDSSKKN